MNSYLVKIVYQIVCGNGRHTPQFDEQLRFVVAATLAEALHKGQAIGIREEDTFYNNRQQLVQWKFIAVTELYAIKDLADGAEVFSQIREADDAASFRNFAHHKASRLQSRLAACTV